MADFMSSFAAWCSGRGHARPTWTGVRHVAVTHFYPSRCRCAMSTLSIVPQRAEELASQALRGRPALSD
jgi:hypothetical protein